jgi:hypothetical protein
VAGAEPPPARPRSAEVQLAHAVEIVGDLGVVDEADDKAEFVDNLDMGTVML